MTLYLVIDPNSIKRLSDHLRIISQIAAALTREMPTEATRHLFLLLAFAPADLETARQLSQRAGNRTVHCERGSVSRRSLSTQESDSGRPLLTRRDHAVAEGRGAGPTARNVPAQGPAPFFKHPLGSATAKIPLPVSEPTKADFSTGSAAAAPLLAGLAERLISDGQLSRRGKPAPKKPRRKPKEDDARASFLK